MVEYAKTAEGAGVGSVDCGGGWCGASAGDGGGVYGAAGAGGAGGIQALQGLDSLLSIVQMPGGVRWGRWRLGKPGAINAAVLAAEILGNKHPAIREKVRAYKLSNTEQILHETLGRPKE